jgi:hypothetical protein
MSGLVEKDPQLRSVVDSRNGRNLLDPADPNPLVVDVTSGEASFEIAIHNGPEGLMDLAISSDEPWLEPLAARLSLLGGESAPCRLKAKADCDGEFANVLLSWEGNASTLCQAVMVMRKNNNAARATVPPSRDARQEAVRSLVQIIKQCGGTTKFISIDEEHKIFRKGGGLDFKPTQTESILNRCCSEGGWTRQSRLTESLTTMLRGAAQQHGAIDEQTFTAMVDFAAKRQMPKRDAEELCVTLMLDNGWNGKGRYLPKKRKQFNL